MNDAHMALMAHVSKRVAESRVRPARRAADPAVLGVLACLVLSGVLIVLQGRQNAAFLRHIAAARHTVEHTPRAEGEPALYYATRVGVCSDGVTWFVDVDGVTHTFIGGSTHIRNYKPAP